MKTLLFVAALTGLIAVYVVALRPWMRKKEWAQGYFQAVEPFERWLYNKSESILWARFLMLLGAVPGVLSTVGAFDVTPFLDHIPEKWRPWLPLAITFCGIVGEFLRRDTTKPLAIVELPEEKSVAVEQAVKRSEVSTAAAVEVIKEAGA